MKDVPKDTTKRDIREFFEKENPLFSTKLIVTEINFAYDLQERVNK